MCATRSSQIGLAFRTDPTALPQACSLIGAAAMPEIDGNWPHTMRAEPIGARKTAPDVGTVPSDDVNSGFQGRGLPRVWRSPNDASASQPHISPGIRKDRRGMNAASSPFHQNGVSRLAATGRSGFRQQIDGLGLPRASLYIEAQDPRDEARVPRAG